MLGSIFSLAKDLCKTALGVDITSVVPEAFSRLLARTDPNQLPTNHDLLRALQASLSNATSVLAWTLYDPNRKKFAEVLCNCNPLEITRYLNEAVQGEPLYVRGESPS